MVTKVQKWGNSLGLRIPKAFADEAQVEAGSPVDISVEKGVLMIRPVRCRKHSLADLLKGIKANHLHPEVKTGKPIGREVW